MASRFNLDRLNQQNSQPSSQKRCVHQIAGIAEGSITVRVTTKDYLKTAEQTFPF